MSIFPLEVSQQPDSFFDQEQQTLDEGYNLSPKAMAALEADLVGRFKESYPDQEGVVVFAVPPTSPYADFARTSETIAFPGYDSAMAMRPYEQNSLFLYTVNLDGTGVNGERYIAHIKRIVKSGDTSLLAEMFGTGLEVIDDRLKADISEESCSLTDIMEANQIKSFGTCMNVTSNMAVPGIEPTRELPYSLLSYKAVFEIALKQGTTHIFAYVNKDATRSLNKLGVRADLLGGHEFHLPIPGRPGEYDDHFVARCLPDGAENRAAFSEPSKEFPLRRLVAERHVPILYIS